MWKKLIGPLLELINKIYDDIKRARKNSRKKSLSEDIKAGRGAPSRRKFDDWVQREKDN